MNFQILHTFIFIRAKKRYKIRKLHAGTNEFFWFKSWSNEANGPINFTYGTLCLNY
jgi:hypothetical protein